MDGSGNGLLQVLMALAAGDNSYLIVVAFCVAWVT